MQLMWSPFGQGVVDTTGTEDGTVMRRANPRVVAAAVVSVIALAGCSGGNDDKPDGRRSPSPATGTSTGTAETDAMSARAAVATVTGRLGAARRDALADSVTSVVDGWLNAAYLGDFPRSDYSGAFAGFTTGAAAQAKRNLALMSNAEISSRIDTATATRRSISLDVLSIAQKPVGVTATVDLVFETTGAVTGPQEVTGTLDLTPDGDGWKIFGFAIGRTPTAPTAPAATASASPAATSESAS
jgi:hypothetical protein